MEILTSKDKLNIRNCVATIGNFDGLHLGHSKIINLAKKIANTNLSRSLLITFNPHPVEVLDGDAINYLITSFKKKIELLSGSGLDFLYIIDFDSEFANIEADDFIKFFLCKKFNPSDIVIGYDHFFGKDRKGSFELLNKYKKDFSYNLHKVEKFKLNNLNVKSSIIRNFIKDGLIKEANSFLGRRFSFSGNVVRGKGLGEKLSFPTANIEVQSQAQLIPKKGVYHTELFIKKDNKAYDSVCNIGIRPTFSDNKHELTIEVHILTEGDFNIYNHDVELIFKERIRDEIKFNDEKELINQINLDKEYCINN